MRSRKTVGSQLPFQVSQLTGFSQTDKTRSGRSLSSSFVIVGDRADVSRGDAQRRSCVDYIFPFFIRACVVRRIARCARRATQISDAQGCRDSAENEPARSSPPILRTRYTHKWMPRVGGGGSRTDPLVRSTEPLRRRGSFPTRPNPRVAVFTPSPPPPRPPPPPSLPVVIICASASKPQ